MTTCERTPEPRTDPRPEPERREPTPEEVDACVEHVLRCVQNRDLPAAGLADAAMIASGLVDDTVDELIHRATMPINEWTVEPNEGLGWCIWEAFESKHPKLIAVVWDKLEAELIVFNHNHPLGELTDLRDAVESALARMPTEEWP